MVTLSFGVPKVGLLGSGLCGRHEMRRSLVERKVQRGMMCIVTMWNTK